MTFDANAFSADRILDAEKQNDPESIFSYDDHVLEARRLLSRWHTDRNKDPKADDVATAIIKLRESAIVKHKDGTWKGRMSITLEREGKQYEFKHVKSYDIDVGKMFLGRKVQLFLVTEENQDLYENAVNMIESIRYPTQAFETEFRRFLPSIKWKGKTDKGFALVLNKDSEDVVLQDIVDQYLIPGEHVAWMVNRLYNVITFLDHIGIMHGGIDTMSMLVNPVKHGAILSGGWWYSKKFNDKLVALPSNALNILPKRLITEKRACSEIDQLLIKAYGIQCMGDASGVGSSLVGKVPARLLNFLRDTKTDSSLKNYKKWESLLVEQFGPRKFVEFNGVTFDALYEQRNGK